jgi:hypothetical protein
MTTLAADQPRDFYEGKISEIPVIASDIIYQGAAVGVVNGTGHARPLTTVDRFVGFAEKKCDNAAGAAAAKSVRVFRAGVVKLAVTGAVITDLNQPVYAADDNSFQFTPVGGVFVGFVRQFVSAGVVMVEYDTDRLVDPWKGYKVEALGAATKTLDVEDVGKAFFVTVDSVITLPATAVAISVALVCMGPFGTVQISADPVAADKIMGPDIAGTDNKDLINTKATACRGDFVVLRGGHADGFFVDKIKGTWATEG